MHYIFKKDLENATEISHPQGNKNGKQCRLLRIPHGDHFHDVLDCGEGNPLPTFTDEEEEHGTTANVPFPNSNPTIVPKQEWTLKSPEVQPYLDYIAYAYGVEKDSIRLQGVYDDQGVYRGQVFAFQNMEQGQDKSHVHPWVIPLENFILPETDPSIPAEIRFARELTAVAKRMRIPTTAIRILKDRFEVPHGDHSHSLKIQNQDGIQPYLANQLKEVTPRYIPGELDEATVIQKIDELCETAKQKFATDAVMLQRVLMSLQMIQERLPEKGNSTRGYLEMIEKFEKRYIQHTTEEEAPASPLAQKHESIIHSISELDVTDYGITKDDLRSMANAAIEAENSSELQTVSSFVDALRAANDRPGVEGMRYLYFFTQHLYDKELSFALREQVASLIQKISTSTIIVGEEEDASPLFVPSYHTKTAIQEAHETFDGKVDSRTGDAFKTVTAANEEGFSTYDSMKEFANEALDSDQKDDSIPSSDFRYEEGENGRATDVAGQKH